MTASERRLRAGLQVWKLHRTYCSVHRAPGRPTSMRVDYSGTGYQERVTEFVCFEHSGRARARAAAWWRMHGGSPPIPFTAAEACAMMQRGELKQVVEVIVDAAQEPVFPIVVGHRHAGGDLESGLSGQQ